jgi:ankyrin repeat protein
MLLKQMFTVANFSTEPVRIVHLILLIMAFGNLSNEIIFHITDALGPKDIGSLLRTARRFSTVLSAKFYDMALTYTRTTGETVLLWAALHNCETTFKSLLERGADISIQNEDGDTVLHHLATKANLHLLALLLRHPHDIDVRNDKGETPLLCAVQAGKEEAVEQLLQAGADPSASSASGPEAEARRQLELEIHENNRIRQQSQRRAEECNIGSSYNVGRYGERFKKPLHFAAQKGHRNIVKLLFNAGVDISAMTYHERTALHYAAIGKHEDVFQLLLEAGINVSTKDYFGMTASGYAFSSRIDGVETNARKRLCQRPSNGHQVRKITPRSNFPYGPRSRGFPSPPFFDLNFSRREVDSTANSSLQGSVNAKELQQQGMKRKAMKRKA